MESKASAMAENTGTDTPKGGKLEPVVQKLKDMVRDNGWEEMFEKAIAETRKYDVPEMKEITSFDDWLRWASGMLRWIPKEDQEGKDIYHHLCLFYVIIDQPSLQSIQSPISPESAGKPLKPLSKWVVEYAREMGKFLDTPDSLTDESLETFYKSPEYRMNEYMVPRGGFRTFNEFFARHYKPGYRPIADIANPRVIVSPADSTFGGKWPIKSDSTITVKHVTWSIAELLTGSPYQDEFKDGIFMHSYLAPYDYHRQHAPVAGEVLEARMIEGQAYLEVTVQQGEGKEAAKVNASRDLSSPDTTGYQFVQMRALFVLKTEIGLVAVLPIGMSTVSSVVLTAEKGRKLYKGEEISYFQFGGSDLVLIFQQQSKVEITAQDGKHYDVGTQIGVAHV